MLPTNFCSRHSRVGCSALYLVGAFLAAAPSHLEAQELGQPLEMTPDEAPADNSPSVRDYQNDGSGIDKPHRERRLRGSILPRAEMPFWEYIYRKVQDPSADVHMYASKDKKKAGASETIWAKMGRALGMQQDEPEVELAVDPADGRMRPVPADRRSDRLTNTEFLEAEEHFRRGDYAQARRAFKKLAKKYRDKPLEEDILFMKAESEFKLDWLPTAQDSYGKLLAKYPTTRYMPQAVQRTYDIAYFWLEDSRLRAEGQPGKYTYSRYVNLFDNTRPWVDTEGRAIEAIETIQQYDPFGPLTDDAVMMAGAHNFVSDHFIQAASYYEQLVTDQPRSEHASKALFLSGQAYLRSYYGPQYDDADLDGAYRMTKLALSRGEEYTPEQKRRLEADLRAIYVERARRDFEAGEDFRRRKYYTSAKYYYQLVLKDHPDTDWARRAEERLREIGDKETTKFQVADLMWNPFQRPSQPAADPFERDAEAKAADVGNPKTQTTDDSLFEQPEAAQDPEEPKSRFNLRNWLDKF